MITCTFEDGNVADNISLRHAVADVLVLNDKQQILLAKRAPHLLEGGKWAMIGGYVEMGETIAESATREVLEETGWNVRDMRLMRINDNPNRPHEDRQNVSFVYFCQATDQTGTPDDESTELRWFNLDNLPPAKELAFDHIISIDLYRHYLKQPFQIPFVGAEPEAA